MGNIYNELDNFQVIPRDLIFDSTLSDRARFVYCFMAAKPKDWEFYLTPMAKEIGYSIDTLRKYINELIDSGWIVKGEQQKNDSNLFGAVSYTIRTTKISDTENFRHGENPTQQNIDYNIIEINNKEKSKKEDEKEFIDEIYKQYPSKCPVRKISTGKCAKNKEQIKKLLKTYTKEQIKAVVSYEIETKKGKTMLKNFGTFLNNFPDPNELSIVPTNGEYKPSDDSGDIFFNKTMNCYGSVKDPTMGVNDGYTKSNRPKGAKLTYQMYLCVWDYDNKVWLKEDLIKK